MKTTKYKKPFFNPIVYCILQKQSIVFRQLSYYLTNILSLFMVSVSKESLQESLSGEEKQRLRERFGLSLQEMATALGVVASTVHRWEKGHPCPDLSEAVYVALRARTQGIKTKRAFIEQGRVLVEHGLAPFLSTPNR